MVVVDTSVVISWLRKERNPRTDSFSRMADHGSVLLGDLILMEVLQGARSDRDATTLKRKLLEFDVKNMVDREIAEKAAHNFRVLRGLGITIRRQVDLLIGTFCIVHGHDLLHADRDFEPMERHLGLRVASGPEPIH